MSVNPEAISNINPITVAMGETEDEYLVVVTNSGTNAVFEPLTKASVFPGQSVSAHVQGALFLAGVQSNYAAIQQLHGANTLEVVSGVIGGGSDWPVVVAATGGSLSDMDEDGFRTAQWDGSASNYSPLNPESLMPAFSVFTDPISFDSDFLITFVMPPVSNDDVILIGLTDYPYGNFDTEPLVGIFINPLNPAGEALISNKPGSTPILVGNIPEGELVQLRCASGQITATSMTIGTDVAAPESSIADGSGKSLFVLSLSATVPNPVTFRISAP